MGENCEPGESKSAAQMPRLAAARGAARTWPTRSACLLAAQEAVGQDASSMEELMERVQRSVADGAVDSVTITVGTQARPNKEGVQGAQPCRGLCSRARSRNKTMPGSPTKE